MPDYINNPAGSPTSAKNATSIREWEYPLTENIKDKGIENTITARNMLFWDEYRRFWQTSLSKGRECWDYVVADYFSQDEIDDYDLKEKIMINIPGLINKVNAMESMQLSGRRNGVILPVGGGVDTPDKETINYVLQAIQRDNDVANEKTNAYTDGMVTGYPQIMWFDKDYSWNKGKNLCVFHEHWDAVLLDPFFSKNDLSDCHRIMRGRLMGKDEMKIAYPKRKDVIEREITQESMVKEHFASQNFNANERDVLYQFINSTQDTYRHTGKMYVIESLFWAYIDMEVWWDTETGDFMMLPPEWDEQAISRWKESNPQMRSVNKTVRLLWTTANTLSGLLLENNKHWFQTNEFPCEVYVPKMWNNKPHGMVEFLRGTTKAEAIARIEHLHSLRMVNDDLIVLQENSVINGKDLNRERARTAGTVVVREGVPVGEAIQFPMAGKRENVGWSDFAQDMMNNTDRLSTNPNYEGMTQSSQESAKVVDTRNRAVEKKFSPFLNTYHKFDLRVTRKMLMMIPYIFTEHTIIRHIDKNNKSVVVELNKVAKRDMMTGDPTRIINNLVGAKYDYVPALVDDSISAREFETSQFVEIARDILPNVPQEYWPEMLENVGNRFALEFAQKMRQIQEEMKKQKPQPEPMKKTLSINSEDLLHNPLVQQILAKEGILEPKAGAVNPTQSSPTIPNPAEAQPQLTNQGVV